EELIGTEVVAEKLVACGLILGSLCLSLPVLVAEGSVKQTLNCWPEVNLFEERRLGCEGHCMGGEVHEAHLRHGMDMAAKDSNRGAGIEPARFHREILL